MSDFHKNMTRALEHGERMFQRGTEYSRVNTLSEVIYMLENGNYETGLHAAQAVIDLKNADLNEKLKGEG